MDRRAFMQSVSSLGATTALPAFALSGDRLRPTGQGVIHPRIGMIAIGGAGGEILSDLRGRLPYLSRSIAIDVDRSALIGVAADEKILIAGAFTRPRDAQAATLLAGAARPRIADAVADLDIAFIVAGMSGVAGTAISPIVAEVLQEKQIMSIATAFTPINSEGRRSYITANAGIAALQNIADVTFDISSEVLSSYPCVKNVPVSASPATFTFERLYLAVTGPIADSEYLIGVDMETLGWWARSGGRTSIGYGIAGGKNACEMAARMAITHPLLRKTGANFVSKAWLFVEAAPETLRLSDIRKLRDIVRGSPSSDVSQTDFIYGASWNETLADEYRVTILAHGIE